jgi:hypothetical protein
MAGAASLAAALDAHRCGNEWQCACPLECGYDISFRVAASGNLLIHCFGGCDYHEIELALVQHGILDDDDTEIVPPQPVERNTAEDRRAASRKPVKSIRRACCRLERS